ncbi:deoxygenase [Leptospira selangorensis]|uniref:Deoxygenase n=1 Tax=Leptospira selangorensis TaxID=2484982 RepID=A0A5F2C2E3_9LEPT|nr:phytanoyl-CoA dioxygenase family protein [Leptospira selangorensis]TGM17095.1 deoxygenase [Leptospira selangorensis]TGM21433.1 deoxygenase [Leptospira selangorensis]
MDPNKTVSFGNESLTENGYFLYPNFFSPEELENVRKILLDANSKWKTRFPDESSVNSAYLTSPDFCIEKPDRLSLFRFISEGKLVELAKSIIQERTYFLNTQLFFNPKSTDKRNYWHRDLQYLGVPEEEQKNILKSTKVFHFRIPFYPDPGLEFIPGSHARWDNEEEYDVRLEKNGHKNYEDLPGSVLVSQNPGDLLVFSAHLIHRGIYGQNRHSLDILYTNFPDKKSNSKMFRQFPEESILSQLENPEIFEQSED